MVSADFLSVARRRLVHPWPLVEYLLLTTQTHALCGSLAFFAMLGFYPLSLLLISLAKYVLHSPEVLGVVRLTLYSYFFVLPLIFQYARFGKTKKLFHDEFSSTVIGERLATQFGGA